MENLRLNVSLLKKRVPNLTSAARAIGLRPATVSNLCTGKIPVGRAEVKTIVALASLAKCSLDELILRDESVEMIETKIKVLDLFAPIAKGGTVGLVARPGMGQLAILDELFRTLKKEGYVTMLLQPNGVHPELNEMIEEVDIVTNSIEETYGKVKEIDQQKDIVFATDREHVITGAIFDLQEKLQTEGINNITTFLVDLKGEVVDENIPYGPLETLWYFDVDLVARHKYPAVNPIYSTSTVLEGVHLDEFHVSIQQRAQKLLRRYRELRSLVNVKGVDGIPASEIQTYQRGERLEAYLTQPFFVAEPFSGKKGDRVSLIDTLKDVQSILNGSLDSAAVESLHYIGKITN